MKDKQDTKRTKSSNKVVFYTWFNSMLMFLGFCLAVALAFGFRYLFSPIT